MNNQAILIEAARHFTLIGAYIIPAVVIVIGGIFAKIVRG